MYKIIINNGTGMSYDAYVNAVGGVTTKNRITVRKRASIFGIYSDGEYTGKWYFSLDHAIEAARKSAMLDGDFYEGVEQEV